MTNDSERAVQTREHANPDKVCRAHRRVLPVLLRASVFTLGLIGFWAISGAENGLTAGEALLMSTLYTAMWCTGRLLARPMKEGLTARARRLRRFGRTLAALCCLTALFAIPTAIGLMEGEQALLLAALYAAVCLGCALTRKRRAARQKCADSVPLQTQTERAIPSGPRRRPRAQVLVCVALPLLLLTSSLAVKAYLSQPADIPESLQVFAQKYPEASSFVQDYPRARYAHPSMDVSDEVKKGVVPLFIQWDERWGYADYGGGFFGTNGCGPTCLSMVVCGLTGDSSVTPYAVAQYCEEMGWYTPGAGTSWSLMSEGARHYGLSVESGSVSTEYVTGQLEAGKVLIASMKPGDFTYTGHFIVLTGLNAEGQVLVNDSNSPKNSARAWDVQTLVDQMKGVWAYAAE